MGRGFCGSNVRGGEEAAEGVVARVVEIGEAELEGVRVVAEAEGAEEAGLAESGGICCVRRG